MLREKRSAAVAGAAFLLLIPAPVGADERMQLGVPLVATEFQAQVGDRVFSAKAAPSWAHVRVALEAQAPGSSATHLWRSPSKATLMTLRPSATISRCRGGGQRQCVAG